LSLQSARTADSTL